MALLSRRKAHQNHDNITRIAHELQAKMSGSQPGIFNKQFWQGRLLEWAMADPDFRVDLFRLIDVLPTLRTNEDISAHIDEYLLRPGRSLPAGLSVAIKSAAGGLGASVAVPAFKKNVEEMARQFIAGHDAASALSAVRDQWNNGFAATADLLGEATLSDAEADVYQARYIDLIRTLGDAAPQWPANSILDGDESAPQPRANVSIKVSALAPNLDPVDLSGGVDRLAARVCPILLEAKAHGVFVNFDLEQWALHEITYALFERLAMEDELRAWPHLGIVVQAYLRSAEADAQRLLDLAKHRGAPLTVRLVKGAYWDYEVVHAREFGYPVPVWLNKETTDANFERITTFLLKNSRWLSAAIGSHNLRSIAHAIAQAESLELPKHAYEFQSLHGMAEPERTALKDFGYRVRVYMPFGELLPGMAYLVRRLLENTSNTGFLRLSHHEHADLDKLLAKPEFREPNVAQPAMRSGDPTTPFENASLSDFTNEAVRAKFAAALSNLKKHLPQTIPVVVAGDQRATGESIERVNPGHTAEHVTRLILATDRDVERAVQTAKRAYPAWRDRDLIDRAKLLDRLADILDRDRFDLAALQSIEVGKPWAEADADIAEANDFCRYYARQALIELTGLPVKNVAGEDNAFFYEGRGPTVVIAPWNFPMAILCGMSTAALVAGNPVIMKPAEQSSATAYALYRRMIEAGIPPDVVQFLPGDGEKIGPLLVEHPDIAQIAFTGSKSVGLGILERAAVVRAGQRHVKGVVCEMGGKNAIIVDTDADIDQAVAGIIASAFGYAGQKCSACSRVITVGAVHDALLPRLIEAARSLAIHPAENPACKIPPVVDDEAHARLLEVIANPSEGASVLYHGDAPNLAGNYIAPAIFLLTDPKHRLMQEELFGPVIAVYHAATFDDALDVANATEFALTGGVFSRRPSHLDRARREFHVGNLYLNRGTTGAIVGRQPFGGFALSGGGTKAGGPGYLQHFCNPRAVTENTMRQGFTTDL